MFFMGYIPVLCSFLLLLSEGQTHEKRQLVDCLINSSTYMKPKKCKISDIVEIVDMKTLGCIVPVIQFRESFCADHMISVHGCTVLLPNLILSSLSGALCRKLTLRNDEDLYSSVPLSMPYVGIPTAWCHFSGT